MSSVLDAIFPLTEEEPLNWPLPMAHLSASMLGTYLRCPEQARQRYILGRKEPPNVKLLWGRADHRALETNWQQKIESHEDIPVSDVQEAFAATLDEAVEESGGESEILWEGHKPGEVKDTGVKLVTAYHVHVSPMVQPVHVERKFELQVPGVPVPVIGYIDLETAGPVIERKTSARKMLTIPGRYQLQAGLYQLATERSVDFHFSVKTKTPAVYTPADSEALSFSFTDRRLALTAERVQQTVRSLVGTYELFGPDEPWPDVIAQDGPCNWCGFRSRCHWWGNA